VSLDPNSELELKFEAPNLEVKKFQTNLIQLDPTNYRSRKTFVDSYYEAPNGEIVRWRRRPNSPELTIKRRKSETSTVDRVEIDLKLHETGDYAINEFLRLSGFKHLFGISKEFTHIFEFERELYGVEVVMYRAYRQRLDGNRTSKKTFVEVEINKKSMLDLPLAQEALKVWGAEISQLLSIGHPLNKSLFEIFSGRKYKVDHDWVPNIVEGGL
jgi:hypothetical protein